MGDGAGAQKPSTAAVRHVDWLDYARFLAALGVVAFHYLFNGIANGKIAAAAPYGALAEVAKYGYLGVDFFFVISGFVIALSIRGRTAATFAVSRVVRLWPAFVLCMTLTTLVRLASGDPAYAVSLAQYLANLTMVPQYFGAAAIDGVYWTLTCELWFYAAVAGLIVLRVPLGAVLLPWLLAIVALKFTRWGALPLLGTHYAWFLVGAAVFLLRERVSPRRVALLGAAALVAVQEASGAAAALGAARATHYSPTVIAAVTAGFVALFAALALSRRSAVRLPLARPLGLLTYPLYLLHAYAGYILLSAFGGDGQRLPQTLLLVVAMIGASALVVYGFERPTAPLWRRLAQRCVGVPVALLERRIGRRIGGEAAAAESCAGASRRPSATLQRIRPNGIASS